MRYRVVVELKAARVVTLDARSAREALEAAEDVAYPGRHRRDKIKAFVAPGYPKKTAQSLAEPRVEVPD